MQHRHCARRNRAGSYRGFTLVEILIVVSILGVLAAIVIPQFANSQEEAARTAFMSNLRQFARAAEAYMVETGEILVDASSGQIPTDFDDYIRAQDWENGTPIGGVWDAEANESGITSAIGVHFDGTGTTRNDAFMLTIDEQFDDGDLATGSFRKLASDRYYMIVRD